MGSYCRSCKAIEKKFKLLASNHPSIEFYEVDGMEEEEIACREEVAALPSAIIYASGKQIEKLTCGPKTFDALVRLVEKYSQFGFNEDSSMLEY